MLCSEVFHVVESEVFCRGKKLAAACGSGRTRVYKPGSVLTAIYLDPGLLLGSSRLPGTVGPTYCSSTALLRIEFTAPQCSHGMGGLLPHLFTLTDQVGSAVYLCCTCPEVTLGRRYLLSSPYGARTFLICVFSYCSRGCPTWSLPYCTLPQPTCQISCKFFLKRVYYINKNLKLRCLYVF